MTGLRFFFDLLVVLDLGHANCLNIWKERSINSRFSGESSISFQFNFTLRNMMASSGQTSWQQKHLMHFE